ncbi:MAG TPA: hypothetical protein PKH92_00325 [Anaerolineaceae bacterium]|jgi:hypothetical protein|nr:hypothetical protein [Anaerolineaceae bacterium]HOD03463.1 hypothetical protein [Anaerolineaceae bacterium]
MGNFYRYFIILCALMLLTGCTPPTELPPTSTTGAPTATQPAPEIPTRPAVETTLPASTETQTARPATATALPVFTPTPDLRQPPEDWQNWPIVPRVSARAIEIYQTGLALGNNPLAFSKVGDCQSISEVLMGIYDQPMYYDRFDGEPDIQEAIRQFAGSFGRDGVAVNGGFNAAAVLSPIWADPDLCEAGETPIECEYRINRPSIVIISLEVWWEGRTPEHYEQYMRQIIEFFIERGTLPILATKADNVEGDHSINLTTARLAYAYDIPLWNFWSAAQPLPYHGMDPNRDDGFHIAPETWGTRSVTALRTLSAVWHAVK